jgi:hypothetical protein
MALEMTSTRTISAMKIPIIAPREKTDRHHIGMADHQPGHGGGDGQAHGHPGINGVEKVNDGAVARVGAVFQAAAACRSFGDSTCS